MKTNRVAVAALIAAVAAPAAFAQEAVQWRVEDGGNGHWYQLVISGPIVWTDAREACGLRGGYLMSSRSDAEESLLLDIANRAEHPDAWVVDFGGNAAGPWLGGYQPVDALPEQPWAWVSGEEWDWVGWAAGEPNGGFGPGLSVTAMLGWAGSNTYRGWADAGLLDYPPYPLPVSYVIEWSADCNGDGIVDYGQILDGTFEDANANGVPDTCECFADVNQDGVVNGADISAVLGFWGQAGKPLPAADITRDGNVDGADLAVLLGSWGECP